MMKNDEEITDISYNISLVETILNSLKEAETTDKTIGNITFTINTTRTTYTSNHDLYLKDITSFAIINKSNYMIWIISGVITISFLIIIILISIKNKKNKAKRKARQIKYSKSY